MERKNINTKTEEQYRAIIKDSSSSLKDFSLDRRKYYKKYILNENIEDKDSQAITMGKIVETLLLEPEVFDKKFYLSACATPPTGLMLDFVTALVEFTIAATDEHGQLTKSFADISQEAYVKSGFKISYDAVLKKFDGSDAEIYYNELLQVRSNNLLVVSADDVTNAERIVEELKSNSITKNIVNLIDSIRWEIKNQFQIEDFIVDNHHFKAMIDKIIVDHSKKEIYIYDLKTVWAVENFYTEYYLYRRAYIQAYLYYKAINSLTEDKNNEWYHYNVFPPRFIVCDSINYYSPLIYTLNKTDLVDSYEGFEYNGRYYPGVKEIITNLKWAIDTDIWNISRENYLNNGIVNIKHCQ